jgi:head-tail adaptor
MAMQAGKRDQYVTIEKLIGFRENASQDRVPRWKTYVQRWARIVPEKSPKSETELQYVVELPYDTQTKTINHTFRFAWNSSYLNVINAVNVGQANSTIRCTAIESTQVSV